MNSVLYIYVFIYLFMIYVKMLAIARCWIE
jgi:hypothetical protein